MTSYVFRIVVLASLVTACAKTDQPAVATTPDSAKPAATAPVVAVAPDTAAKTTPDSASTAATMPSMAPPPNSAAKGPPPSGPSTQVGVYTNEQANRGKQVYAGSCRSCHSPTSHTGEVFAGWWQNKRLSELYNFIATQMPKNDPGTLAPEDVADVVAYLLKMNEMPTGSAELYP